MKKILSICMGFVFVAGCGGLKAQDGANVYLKPAVITTSSFDTTPDWAPLPDAGAVSDGDLLTRWASHYIEGQWLILDFGKEKVFNRLVIVWEAAYAQDYDVLVSSDNQNWYSLISMKGQDGKTDEIEVSNTRARYVKILSVKRVNPDWGISIWEVLIFGPAQSNPGDLPLESVHPQFAGKFGRQQAALVVPEEALEAPVPSPGILECVEFQKGVVYTSWQKGELGSAVSDRMLEHLKDIGIRHLGIMVVWYQDDVDSTKIYRDQKDTPTDRDLAHVINKAHSLGMKVMLKPHVDLKTNQWRGDIIPSIEWFASYKDYILYYVKLAQRYNVEFYSIGTELLNATTKQWEKQWDVIIDDIKKEFSGKLVYSANWDEYPDVGFWYKLDFVGIDAYFALTAKKDPTKEELIAGWKSAADTIDKWLKEKKINKPVIYTEIGYCSADGANIQPWNVLSNATDAVVDQQEQAQALEAMLEVSSGYPWFKGLYWWNYFPRETVSPLGYIITGKKAEEVLAEWLKKL